MSVIRSTGLVDKLNGVKHNRLLNGAFESNVDSWVAALATLSAPAGGVTGNRLSIANTSAAAGSAHQDVPTTVGRIYRLSVSHQLGTGAAGGRVQVGTVGAPASLINSDPSVSAAWAALTFVFIASATTTRITLSNVSTVSGQTTFFDDVVLDEIFDGLVEIMRDCRCNIYTLPRPATADAAATGNRLVTITLSGGGAGLVFTPSNNGVVEKPANAIWKGLNALTGTAAWFRFYEAEDNPATNSTVMARFDGSVGVSGTNMVVGSTSYTAGLETEITGFTYTAPRN